MLRVHSTAQWSVMKGLAEVVTIFCPRVYHLELSPGCYQYYELERLHVDTDPWHQLSH